MKKIAVFLYIIFLIQIISCRGDDKTSNSFAEDSVDQIQNLPSELTSSASGADVDDYYKGAVGDINQDSSLKYNSLMKENIKGENLEFLVSGTPDSCQVPKDLSDLNSGMEHNLFKFDGKSADKARDFGFNGTLKNTELLFIQDVIRYKNIKCGAETKKVGVGLRCFIYVKNIKRNLNFNKLETIAANSELSQIDATFSLKILGILPTDIIPMKDLDFMTGNYDVNNFRILASIFEKFTSPTFKEKWTIKPVLLP